MITVASLSVFCNHYAVDLNIEKSGPCRNIDENAGGWIDWKKRRVDCVYLRKVVDGGAVDVALKDAIEIGTGRFEAKLHLLQDELGLVLY